MKTSRVLIVLVLLCLASNVLLSLAAISRVRRSALDYVVTEERFISAVYEATTNFLSSVSGDFRESPEEQLDVQVRFVDGMCIYYRPRTRRWVLRYNGSDFVQGDYFEGGVLLRISEGKAYCKTSEGVAVLRPKPRADEPAPRVGLGARVSGDEEAPL